MGDRPTQNIENTKALYVDASNLYGWAMNQLLPYKDIRLTNVVKLVEIF